MHRKLTLVVTLLIADHAVSAWGEDLAGKVLQDHTGTPVASADVRVYKLGVRELAADLETDSQGRFEAVGLEPGEYRLEVEKPSYLNATSSIKIAPGAAARLNIRLVRRGSISGTVTISGGKAPANGIVTLLTKTRSGLRPMARMQGTYSNLDEVGRYRLFNLPPGEYIVAVSYGAHVSAVSSTGNVPPNTGIGSGFSLYPTNVRPEFLTIAGGDDIQNVDFTILPGTLFNVSGKVELPLPKKVFWVALTAVAQPFMAVALTPAAEDGTFHFAGIPGGSYHVFATGPVTGRSFMGAMLDPDSWYARERVEVIQDIPEVILSPRRGVDAVVRLKPERGAESVCPASATVRAIGLEDWGAGLDRDVQIRRDKDSVFKNLAPSKYRLIATGLGEGCFQPGEATFDLSAGDPGPSVISLSSAGSIRGHVAGEKANELAVVLIAINPSGDVPAIRNAVPDSEGRFGFATLAPGKYRIAVHSGSEASSNRWMGNSKEMVEIEVEPGKPTELELPSARTANSQQ